ncbi:hypothetical protein FJ872_17915 [Mesorhizobium sp. B2-5-9]|uniref:hypothetical protein n=1 Tax=Mesorhizobium sp. B2-5-9 TaxID=2589921 RepID=UPI00112943AE|nr:hypothetical protein [Mesorhizobium sp. B2-5-9]TPK16678.1 hypothetical protein FJ872_17915 [Mesorhizobium sp. B2-5-9]
MVRMKKLFDEVPFQAKRRKPPSYRTTPEERQAGRKSQNSAISKLSRADGGKGGAKVTSVKIRISGQRSETRAMRSAPGTFEWRYGRKKQDVLFHAGSHLARLWERAGVAVASSADFLRGTGSGYATGISDGRVAAIDKLKGFVKEMGRVPAERMIDYCVVGLTTAEIAMKHGATEREMAPVLHHDLRTCAQHFNFLAGGQWVSLKFGSLLSLPHPPSRGP